MSNSKLYFLSVIALIIFFLSIFSIKNFRIDASSDTLVAQNDDDYIYYNKYNKIFKSENFLVLAIKIKNLPDNDFLENIESISSKIDELDQVSQVFSILDAPILFQNNTSLTTLDPNKIENLRNTDLEIQKVLQEFINNPIYVDQIISKNADVFSIIIYLKENKKLLDAKENYKRLKISKKDYFLIKSSQDKKRSELIEDIRFIISNADDQHLYFLGGVEMITNDVINFVKNDIIIFSISVILIIIIVLFYIFRQIIWVTICLSSSLYSLLVIFGILGFFQIEVTAISSNFSALIFILSISMNIHIINYYRQLNISENYLSTALKNMFWPCLYTTLTTIIAFGSLLVTDIKPIIDFGYVMIIALITSLLCSFTILPLLILILINNNNSKKNYLLKFNLNSLFLENPYKILLISILFFMISIGGILKLGVENSFVNYFKKNTEIYKGMKLIDNKLGGTTPLDIILHFNKNGEVSIFENQKNNEEEDNLEFEEEIFDDDLFTDDVTANWFTDEKIEIILNTHRYLENRIEIGKVQSIISLIDLANLINKEPLNIFQLSVLYQEIPQNIKKDLIYPYLSIDNNMAKITARVKDSMKIKRKEIIEDTKFYLKKNLNETIETYRVNGLLVLYNNMLESLFNSQIKSIGLVIFLIFLMFIILFKSIKLSIIAIIPNIMASTLILGTIGYLNIPLDIMTITIAAISIGIAVDNTIHYLYRFIQFNKNKKMRDSIKATNSTAGIAVLTTSLTISIGFSILSLSNFIPTVIFGIFTSMAMIFAMIGVLIILPSLLIISYK